MAETILSARQIVVRYGGTVALNVESLEIKRGELLALIGPNGAGKSTLLRVLGLLQNADAGTVEFGHARADSRTALALRRRIATVFQEPLLLNESVYNNAALGLRLRGVKGAAIERRLRPWLERLKIAHLAARSARTLSSGEAQRTSLARALVLEPEILLLDEPFGALDASGRETLLRDFQRIVKDTGITTVLVTHDRNEAYSLADRVAVVVNGCLAQLGSKDEVYSRPATEAVAAIVGIENRLHGQVEASNAGDTRIRIGEASIIVPAKFAPSTKIVLCVRAEDLSLARADGASAMSQFHGTVSEVSTGMHQWRCTVACNGFELIAAVIARGCYRDLFTIGTKVTACFDPAKAHIIGVGS